MANPIKPDIFRGVGDALVIRTKLIGSDKLPIDLTGCTSTFEVAPQHDGDLAIKPVTPDADQVANTGDCSVKVFETGESIRATYEGRFIVVDSHGDQISVLDDRLIIIEVTRRPGT